VKPALIANVILFNAGWFACILGAANGLPWLGPAAVLPLALGWLAFHRWSSRTAALYAAAFPIGYAFDHAALAASALAFPERAALLTPVPLWMPVMWVNFATMLPLALRFLKGRYLVAALFGLLGGPAAYYAGMNLGAVTLPEPLPRSLAIIAAEWAIATPLLVLVSAKLHRAPKPQQEPQPAKRPA